MTTDRHTEHVENGGAYLLGALPELEAQAFERHMAGCNECMREVERLRLAAEGAAALGGADRAAAQAQGGADGDRAERSRRERAAGARAPPLLSASGALAAGGVGERGTLEVDDDGEDAVLRLQGMPAPQRGQVLQAWVQRGSEIAPSAVFATRSDGTAVAAITEDLDGVDRVMVTRERPGGATRPGEDPPVVVEL